MMTLLKFRLISSFVMPIVVLLALVLTVYAAVRIGGSSFSANGQLARDYQYTGGCPVDLQFDWGVVNPQPSAVAYRTTRSDGARSSPRSIGHPGGNRSVPVIEHWRLGANSPRFRNYSGWMQLDIESPNPASKRISFTIHCQ